MPRSANAAEPGFTPLRHGPWPGILAIGLITLLFAVVLVWQVQHRSSELVANQKELMQSSATGAARMIERFIAEARRRVHIFALENAGDIAHLAQYPADDTRREALRDKLGLHFPHFFAFTIADPGGRVLLDDFDGLIGDVCRLDIDAFAREGHPSDVQIHPNPDGYHFDIISRWRADDAREGLFFVSFSPDWPARILGNSQLPGHTLLLLHRGQPDLVEISAAGSRPDLSRPIRLTPAETQRIEVRVPVAGTQWVAVDLPPEHWQHEQTARLHGRALAAFLVLFGLAVLAVWLILRFDRGRRGAEWRLQTANADLEFRVDQRTLELSDANRQLRAEAAKLEQARLELQTSEGRFRQLVEGLPSAIIVVDRQGTIVQANPQSAFLFGYALDDLLGRPVEELVPEAVRDQHRWHREGFAAEPSVRRMGDVSLELYGRRRDGSSFPVDVGLNMLQSQDGPRYVAAVTDLTERVVVERDLRVTRGWLQDVIDAMPSVLVGVDLDGRITLWNKGARGLTALPEDQVLGQQFEALFPWMHRRHAAIREAIAERRSLATERLLYPGDSENRYMDVMVYPLSGSEVPGAVIRIDDTTDRVRLEQVLVQSEKMLSIGGLAAGMAHEINNPLSGILQSCQNIQRRLSPELPGNRKAADQLEVDLQRLLAYLEQRGIIGFVDGIRNAAMRSAKIVADMLAFSRSNSEAFGLVQLDDLLDAVLNIAGTDYDMKKKYDFKQVEVERDYDPALGSVYCDRGQIEQVLLNLVTNAAQAMAQGGRPPFRLQLRTRRQDEHALIEIRDNGPGIEPEVRRRIFEPFFTTKPVGVGTGLGLSVSYFIITKQHHGSITVSSEPGNGACFRIRLPLRPPQEPT